MKTLGIVCKDARVARSWEQQLAEFFRQDLNTQVAVLDERPRPISAPVVLLSHPTLRNQAQWLIPQHAAVIVARRSLDILRLPELVKLPSGTRCLVVNNAVEPARETCEELQRLGIEHLVLVPYAPDEFPDLPRAEVAITTGFPELVPPRVRMVIDLGVRKLDVSTLVELAVRLGHPMEDVRHPAPDSTREAVKLLQRQTELLSNLRRLHQRLQAILDNSSDAVLAVKLDGTILAYNARVEQMFGHLSEVAILQEVLRAIPTAEILNPSRPIRNGLWHLAGRDYLVGTSSACVDEETEVVITFRDVTEVRRADRELRRGLRRRGFASKYTYNDIVGQSACLKRAVTLAQRLAPTDLPILLVGESGTGKEILAHAIHNDSPRRDGPFVPANLAALPESLLEGELFGYEEGAFTGARRGGHPGLFEQAHGGTIFLDEVGELPRGFQVKLLRVLQEKEVMRLGGTGIIPVDVRVIAATNRDTASLVSQGHLRDDLYYRLATSLIRIPPLRERPEDIPLLVRYFLRTFGVPDLDIPPVLWERFLSYPWPGNVRQLESAVAVLAAVEDPELVDWGILFYSPPPPASAREDLLRNLSLKGSPQEFRVILEALRAGRAARQRWGRGQIARYAAERGIPLSSEKVRSRLRILSALGLTLSGRGRQGTVLTERGAEFLRSLETMGAGD